MSWISIVLSDIVILLCHAALRLHFILDHMNHCSIISIWFNQDSSLLQASVCSTLLTCNMHQIYLNIRIRGSSIIIYATAQFIIKLKVQLIQVPFTRSIIRRGFFSFEHISSMEWAPMIFVPFASFARKWSTLSVVRLYAHTTKPWSFMLRMMFWPMTAKPMRAISALKLKINFCLKNLFF